MSSPLHAGRQTPVEAMQTCPSPVPRWDRRTEPIVAPETAQQWGNDQDLHNCWGKTLLGSHIETLQLSQPERGLHVTEAALGWCVRAWRRKREMVNAGFGKQSLRHSPMTRLMHTSPKFCRCCDEEPQVSSFLPGAGGCSRLSSSRPHVQDGGDLQSPSFPHSGTCSLAPTRGLLLLPAAPSPLPTGVSCLTSPRGHPKPQPAVVARELPYLHHSVGRG